MQEEVNQKVVSLCIRTGKLTGRILAKAMKMFLDAQKQKSHQFAKGKQSLKQLMEQNAGATSIEVDSSNIKSFDRVVQAYHIRLADRSVYNTMIGPPLRESFTRVFHFTEEELAKIKTDLAGDGWADAFNKAKAEYAKRKAGNPPEELF